MSVEVQGLEVVSPVVDGALVDYWYLQSQAPLTEFMGLKREELGNLSIRDALANYSMAAAGLHNRLLDKRHPGNPKAGSPEAQTLGAAKEQHTVGFLLAFVLLHQGGLTLDKLSDLYARAYEDRVTTRRGFLEDDFYGDFADFTPILDLLDYRMTHPAGQYAAMVMLGIHGGAANPGSPLIEFAKAADNDDQEGQVIVMPSNAELRNRRQERRVEQAHRRPKIR